MKNYIAIFFSCLFLTSCLFGDNPSSSQNLSKDFWLTWFEYKSDQHIFFSTENDGNFGNVIIENTVFAVGYDENFIIVKQHPNVAQKILDRLNDYDFEEQAYHIKNLADTIWLQKNDSVYKKNGVNYHKDYLNRNHLPDSLKPYKSITNYFIVDTRYYERGNRDFIVHKLESIKEFDQKRKELGVSNELTFSIIDKQLE